MTEQPWMFVPGIVPDVFDGLTLYFGRHGTFRRRLQRGVHESRVPDETVVFADQDDVVESSLTIKVERRTRATC